MSADELQNQLEPGYQANIKRDNPMVKFNLVDKDSDAHEIVWIPDKH